MGCSHGTTQSFCCQFKGQSGIGQGERCASAGVIGYGMILLSGVQIGSKSPAAAQLNLSAYLTGRIRGGMNVEIYITGD